MSFIKNTAKRLMLFYDSSDVDSKYVLRFSVKKQFGNPYRLIISV